MSLLTPSQTAQVIEKAAEKCALEILFQEGFQSALMGHASRILASRIEELAGDLASHIVLPMKTVEVMACLSSKRIPAYMPVTRTADGKFGVCLSHVLTHIATRTEPVKPAPRRKTR